MNMEQFLSQKLQKFSIIDFACIKGVYFTTGLLIASCYPRLISLHWLFYLLIAILCALPLYLHLFSQSGTFWGKIEKYLRTNNPANQTLLFLSVFFIALTCATILPILTSLTWWLYILIIAIVAILPLRKSWFW